MKVDKDTADAMNAEMNNEALQAFNNLRPYFIKLFTHVVIFYLAVNGYLNYLQSNDDYSDFIQRMSQPLITKALFIDSAKDCSLHNMTDITGYVFTKIEEGCQCDDKVMVKRDCDFVMEQNLLPLNTSQANKDKKMAAWEKRCNLQYPLTSTRRILDDITDPLPTDPIDTTDTTDTTGTDNTDTTDPLVDNIDTTGIDPNTGSIDNGANQDGISPDNFDPATGEVDPNLTEEIDPNLQDVETNFEGGDFGDQIDINGEPDLSTEQDPFMIDEEEDPALTEEDDGTTTDEGNNDSNQNSNESNTNDSNTTQSQTTDTQTQSQTDTNTNADGTATTPDPPIDTTDPLNFVTSEGTINLTDPIMDTGLKAKLESIKGNADGIVTPDSLNSEFFDDPNDPAFKFPKANKGLNRDDETFTFIPVVKVGDLLVPANDSGDPLDMIKNEKYPTSCGCYRALAEIPEKNILNIQNNQKLCIKKDTSWTTISYLNSITKFRSCPKANRCQKYFCREDNQSCPIIDLWFSTDSKNKTNLLTSSERTRELKYGTEFMMQVLLPMIDIKLSLKNSCSSSTLTQSVNFPLIQNVPCSKAQTSDSLSYDSAVNILNYNDNFYSSLKLQIPFISSRIENGLSFVLESSHAFYRKSISCYIQMQDIDSLFKGVDVTVLNDSANDLVVKLSNILFSFFSIQDYFDFQRSCQLFILIANTILLGVHLASIIIQLVSIKYCGENKIIWKILKYEVYGTFMIDLTSAIVSGYAYFSILGILSIIKQMTDLKCNDDYSNTKYAAYTGALQGTADKSFEVFLVILFKVALVIFSTTYHICLYRSKLSEKIIQKVIFESISEGDSYEEDFDEVLSKKEANKLEMEMKDFRSNAEIKSNDNDDISKNNQLSIK